MERVEELCCYYIALVRSIYLVHQNHHWITKGNDFYGNHLLFERIYKTAADDADLAAEKFIGLFGDEVLDLHMQAQMIGKIMESFSSGDPVASSLKIEKKFLDFTEKFYRIVKEEGKMSLGLDDMIMAIASNREAAVYLLKQASGGQDVMGAKDMKMAGRINLLKRFKKAQAPQAQAPQAFDQNEFLRKLQNEWNALVVSFVPPGKQGYSVPGDLSVVIDSKSGPQPRILANAKLPTAVAPEVQQKIEAAFKNFALQLLPPSMKNNYMIAVGFTTPPAKAMPAA